MGWSTKYCLCPDTLCTRRRYVWTSCCWSKHDFENLLFQLTCCDAWSLANCCHVWTSIGQGHAVTASLNLEMSAGWIMLKPMKSQISIPIFDIALWCHQTWLAGKFPDHELRSYKIQTSLLWSFFQQAMFDDTRGYIICFPNHCSMVFPWFSNFSRVFLLFSYFL